MPTPKRPTLTVITHDGRKFVGPDYKIVRAMRDEQWGGAPTKADYKREVGVRVEQMTHKLIRTDTAGVFLIDLESAGMLTITVHES